MLNDAAVSVSAVLHGTRYRRQHASLDQIMGHLFNSPMQRINQEIRFLHAQCQGRRHHIQMADGAHQKPPLFAQV